REFRVDTAGDDLAHEVGGGEVADGGAAGVEDLQQPKVVARREARGEGLDEILTQEARGTVAVRLVDGEDARGAQAGGGDRGGDLRGVVREVVDHLDAVRATERLEAAGDAAKRRERRRHRIQRDTGGAAGGDRGECVLDIVPPGNGQREA